MAQININIPDEQVTRVLDRLAERFGYDGVGTKAAFIKAYIADQLRQAVLAQERINAAQAAPQDDPGVS